jgi:uncharacterized protein with von Willebrand factor type A (vWA) domain
MDNEYLKMMVGENIDSFNGLKRMIFTNNYRGLDSLLKTTDDKYKTLESLDHKQLVNYTFVVLDHYEMLLNRLYYDLEEDEEEKDEDFRNMIDSLKAILYDTEATENKKLTVIEKYISLIEGNDYHGI